MITLVISRKGGIGKSTLVNALVSKSENAVLIDTDQQGDTFSIFEGKRSAVFSPIAKNENLSEPVSELLESIAAAEPDENINVFINTAGGVADLLEPFADEIVEVLNEIDTWQSIFITAGETDEDKMPTLFSAAPIRKIAWAAWSAEGKEPDFSKKTAEKVVIIPKMLPVVIRALKEHPVDSILDGTAPVPALARVGVRKLAKAAEELLK